VTRVLEWLFFGLVPRLWLAHPRAPLELEVEDAQQDLPVASLHDWAALQLPELQLQQLVLLLALRPQTAATTLLSAGVKRWQLPLMPPPLMRQCGFVVDRRRARLLKSRSMTY
jgi:hypothetical protein